MKKRMFVDNTLNCSWCGLGGHATGWGRLIGPIRVGLLVPVLLLGLSDDGALCLLVLKSLGLLGVQHLALLVTEEEQVGHHVPFNLPGDGSPQPEHFPGEEPPHESDGCSGLVVARDGDVDKLGGRVDIAESDDWDVSVRALGDGLVISAGVGDDQKTWLAESGLDLVSEGT